MSAHSILGKPTRRVDGPLKVTGKAKYAAEYKVAGLLHGYVVASAIAKGRVTAIDATEALAIPGVVEVFTHENRPVYSVSQRLQGPDRASGGSLQAVGQRRGVVQPAACCAGRRRFV